MANRTTESADSIADIATKLEDIAKQFRDISRTMRDRGIESIDMNGITTLQTSTLKRLVGVYASAQRAMLDAKPSDIERKAREAVRKIEERRKKKEG